MENISVTLIRAKQEADKKYKMNWDREKRFMELYKQYSRIFGKTKKKDTQFDSGIGKYIT